MNAPTVLSLFAGIGGIELGLQRAGLRVIGQVEQDAWCRAVLAHHWPEVPRHDDVRTADTWWTQQPRPRVDLVAGGFPCQPFSTAGRRAGIADQRWGWPWMRDVVDAVRPRYVLAENVATLLRDADAFRIILSDLSDRGFDVEWSVVSACSLGAPHTRRRLFLLAHPHSLHGQTWLGTGHGRPLPSRNRTAHPWTDPVNGFLAATPEPDRVADGVPAELDGRRISGLGNAVIPQITEHLGHLLNDHHTRTAQER